MLSIKSILEGVKGPRYKAVRYSRYWYGVIDGDTNLYVKGDVGPYKLLLFKTKEEAEDWCNKNNVIEESFGSDNPLSFYDRIRWEFDNFCELHPEVDYTVTETQPYVIKILNTKTGEVKYITAKSYDGSLNIKYSTSGKSWDSDSLFNHLQEVFIYD